MKTTISTHLFNHLTAIAAASALLFGAYRAPAYTISRANTAVDLSSPGAWSVHTLPDATTELSAPGPDDMAYWGTINAANRTRPLSGDVTWGGINVFSPGGRVDITEIANDGVTNLLTLGSMGLTMTNANALRMQNDMRLSASQEWAIANSRTLVMDGRVTAAGITLHKSWGGLVFFNASNNWGNSDIIVSSLYPPSVPEALKQDTRDSTIRIGRFDSLTDCRSVSLWPTTFGGGLNAGNQVLLAPSVNITNVILYMGSSLTNGDGRTQLRVAAAGNSVASWHGDIICSGDGGSVTLNTGDGVASMLQIGGAVTCDPAWTGTLRMRNTGTNMFLATARVDIGTAGFNKSEIGNLVINCTSNIWGPTTFEYGTVYFGTNNALPIDTLLTMGSGANIIRVDMKGNDLQIGSLLRGTTLSYTTVSNDLCVISSSSTTRRGTLTFKGLPVETSFYDGTILNGISGGSAGLNVTVSGGTVYLMGPNTYAGTTLVKDGASLTVSTRPSGGGAFVVGDNSKLGVVLAGQGTKLSVASLTLSNNCSMDFDLGLYGNPQNAQGPMYNATGIGTYGGLDSVTVNIKGVGFTVGRFPLIYMDRPTIEGAGVGAFKLGTLPAGVTANLIQNFANPSVDLNISVSPNAIYYAPTNYTSNSKWDIATSGNWRNIVTEYDGNGDPFNRTNQYKQALTWIGDMVKFDYWGGQVSNYVALDTRRVKPAFIWFDTPPYNVQGGQYYIGGTSGGIDGTNTAVLQAGYNGIVTLVTSNSFGGDYTLTNGTLRIGHDSAIGKGTLRIGGFSADGVSPATLTVTSDGATPRVLSNSVSIAATLAGFAPGTGMGFGQNATSGKLTFKGPIWDIGVGTRNVTNYCDVEFWGAQGNVGRTNLGLINKYGAGTMIWKNSTNNINGITECREGLLIMDNCTMTNFEAIRVHCQPAFTAVGPSGEQIDNSANAVRWAKMIITNNSYCVYRAFSTSLRVGSGSENPGGIDPLTGVSVRQITNTLEIAATIRFPDAQRTGGEARLGRRYHCGIMKLFPGGDLEVNGIVSASGSGNGAVAAEYCEFTWLGGTMRGKYSRPDYMEALTNCFIGIGTKGATSYPLTAVVAERLGDSAPLDLGINQNLLDGQTLQRAKDTYSTNGVIISTNVNFAQYNYGSGGILKAGSGTLTLRGTNTYKGATVITNGVLETGVNYIGGGNLVVSNRASFGLLYNPGYVNADLRVTVTNNILTFGGATATPATETNIIRFNLGTATNPVAPVYQVTTLNANSKVRVDIEASGLTVGAVPLIKYTGAITFANFYIGQIPRTYTANLTSSGSTIWLNVTAVNPLKWTGVVLSGGLGNWDILTTTNWLFIAAPTYYIDLPVPDAVLFDDSASNTVVNLVTNLSPGGVLFSNSTAKTYRLTGPGSITGDQGLKKLGTGEAILETINTYRSDTTIDNGKLTMGAPNALPSGLLRGNVVVSGNGKLDLGGKNTAVNGLSGNGTVESSSTRDVGDLVLGWNDASSTFSGTIGTLNALRVKVTKTGQGTITLSGTNLFNEGFQIGRGVVKVANPWVFGSAQVTVGNCAIMSTDSSERIFTNGFQWNGDTTFGSPTNNGLLTFLGNVTLNNGLRTLKFGSDVVVKGTFTNGRFAKTSLTNSVDFRPYTTLTLNNGASINGPCEVRHGAVVIDGGSMTSDANWETDCHVTNTFGTIGLARTVFTNTTATLSARGNDLYLGRNNFNVQATNGSNNGEVPLSVFNYIPNSPTNILDLAGQLRFTRAKLPNGRLIMGAASVSEQRIQNALTLVWTTNSVITAYSGAGILNLWSNANLIVSGIGRNPTNNIFISELNFRGGALSAAQPNNEFVEGVSSAYIHQNLSYVTNGVNIFTYNYGAIINALTNDVTIKQALLAGIPNSGGLRKRGAGTLTLDGTNTYTGDTFVSEGALVIPTYHKGGGAFIVTNNATLQVRVGASDVPTLASSKLLLGGTPTGRSTITFDISTNGLSTSAGVINVTTANGLMTTGLVNVVIAGSGATLTAPQTYRLITYSGTIGGATFAAFTNLTLPPGVVATLTHTPGASVDLNVTAVGGDNEWTGAGGNGNWDLTTGNWSLGTYAESDYVTFRDSGAYAQPTVALTGTRSPSRITVDSTVAYTFTGGKISGTNGLAKRNTGDLTIMNDNDYVGGTSIAGGKVRVGHDRALGNDRVTIDAGALSADGNTARTLTNNFLITSLVASNRPFFTNILGDVTDRGLLSLNGAVDLGNGPRPLIILSDVVLAGPVTNGVLIKLGLTNAAAGAPGSVPDSTLTFASNRVNLTYDNYGLSVWAGNLVLDGAAVTNLEETIVSCRVTNGISQLIITNGAALVMTASDANLRVGYDWPINSTNTSGIDIPTNILDVAGLVRFTSAGSGDGRLILGRSGTRGIANLWPGGQLRVNRVVRSDSLNPALALAPFGTGYAPSCEFHFWGGVLEANRSDGNMMEGLTNAVIHNAPAIVDTRGYNCTISQNLTNWDGGTGGLIKRGSGTLTLDGTNYYTGESRVEAGRLNLANSYLGNGPIWVTNGANLTVSIRNPAASLVTTLLTLGTTPGGSVECTFNLGLQGSQTVPAVNCSSLTVEGTVVVNVTATNTFLSTGTYPLIQYGGLSGAFAAFQLGTLPEGVEGVLVDNLSSSRVDLLLTRVAKPLSWTAAADANWYVGGSITNWIWAGISNIYTEVVSGTNIIGDFVEFDDSVKLTRTNVNMVADVHPHIVEFQNDYYDYILGGVGELSGDASVRKLNLGDLIMKGTNDYSGGTIISNGMVRLQNNVALGSGVVTFRNGGLSSDSQTPRALTNALYIPTNPQLGDGTNYGRLTLTGNADLAGGTRTLTIMSEVIMSGSLTNGSITKTGTNTVLRITGDTLWTASAEVQNGTLEFNGAFVTNNGDIRPDGITAGKVARLIFTNSYVELSGNNNWRVGESGNPAATNVLDIAGVLRIPTWTSAGRIIIGRMAPGFVNLFPQGDVAVNYIGSSDVTNVLVNTTSNRSAYSEFNFRGGILRGLQSQPNFMSGLSNAFVHANAIIDTAGFDLTIAQSLLKGTAGAGLVKSNAGTLSLTGSNTFNGPMTALAGILDVATPNLGGNAVTISDGAGFGATITTTNLAQKTLSLASLTLGSSGVVTQNFNLGTNGVLSTPVIWATNLATPNLGTVYVNVSGSALSVGTYRLIKYGGTIGGGAYNFVSNSLPLGVQGTLVDSAGAVDLIVTFVADNLTWNGSSDSIWNTTTANWTNLLAPDTYSDSGAFGDNVTFNDSVFNAARTNIMLAAAYKPSIYNISASNATFSFGGVGRITGLSRLNKSGAAPVTISNANDFTGGAFISGGVVKLGPAALLGSGLVTLSSSSGGAGLASSDTTARTVTNALLISGNPTMGDFVSTGIVTLSGDINFNNGTRDLTVLSDVVMSGTLTNGRINKLGTGTVDTGASNNTTLTMRSNVINWSGTAEVRDGTLVFDGAHVTNTAYIRTDASYGDGLARIVVTNGAVVVQTGNSLRVGWDGYLTDIEGQNPPTNILDVAGTILLTNSYLRFGNDASLKGWGVVNLWTNGLLRVNYVGVKPEGDALDYSSEFNFRGGVLLASASTTNFMNGLTNAIVYAGGAIIDTTNYDIHIDQSLTTGGGGGGLVKLGEGRLRLGGDNTYTGPTVVSNGTLGGSGIIRGPVVVHPAATLEPGESIGALFIYNSLNLQGNTVMEINKDLGVINKDTVEGLTTVTYGGILTIANTTTNGAYPLVAGDAFQLFSASGYAGMFKTILPTTPGPGLVWDPRGLTNNNGTLYVVVGITATNRPADNKFVISWPAAYVGRWIQAQTNANNVGITTNWFTVPGSGSGNVHVFDIAPANGSVYYRVLLP